MLLLCSIHTIYAEEQQQAALVDMVLNLTLSNGFLSVPTRNRRCV